MCLALEKAQNILLEIQFSQSQPNNPVPLSLKIHQDPNTDEGATSHPSTTNSIEPGSDTTVPPTPQPDTAVSVETKAAT